MTMERIKEGLEILLKYLPKEECNGVHFEHDEMFCDGPEPQDLEKADADRLITLGWFYDDEEAERWDRSQKVGRESMVVRILGVPASHP